MAGKRSALLIAADQFEDPELHELRSPTVDVNTLAEVLREPDIGGFEVEPLLVNERNQTVRLAIERFFDTTDAPDLLLLYLSCHGVVGRGRVLYFAMSDTRLTALLSTGVSANHIKDAMRWSRAKGTVVILDCCHSGLFGHGALTKGVDTNANVERLYEEGRGQVILTASNEIEHALDGRGGESLGTSATSVFTEALIEGLRTGDADTDHNGKITPDELYRWACQRIRPVTLEHEPMKFGEWQGDMWIAKSTASPLPAKLREQMVHEDWNERVKSVVLLQALTYDEDPRKVAAAREALSGMATDRRATVADRALEALGHRRPRSRGQAMPEKESGEARPILERADRHRHNRRYEAALVAYDDALRRSPDNVAVLVGRGKTLASLHRRDEALADLDRAVELNSRDLGARIARAHLLSQRGDCSGALADAEYVLSRDAQSAEAFIVRGESRARLQPPDYEGAMEDFARALEIDAENVDALVGRGWALTELGQNNDAELVFSSAIDLDARSSEAFEGRAHLHRRRNEFAKATADLERSLELDPLNAQALVTRGRWRLEDADHPKVALEDFERANQLAPDDPSTWFGCALATSAMDHLEDAVRYLEEALPLAYVPGSWPSEAAVRAMHGNLLLALNRPEEAARSLDHALLLEPGLVEALADRGRANLQLGRPDLAAVDLSAALRSGVENPERLTRLRRDALSELEQRSSTNLPEELIREVESTRETNRTLVGDLAREHGWSPEQVEAITKQLRGTEEIVWVGRCKRPEDIRPHLAAAASTQRLLWSRTRRFEEIRWSDVREVRDLVPAGLRFILRNGRRVNFDRILGTDVRSGKERDETDPKASCALLRSLSGES